VHIGTSVATTSTSDTDRFRAVFNELLLGAREEGRFHLLCLEEFGEDARRTQSGSSGGDMPAKRPDHRTHYGAGPFSRGHSQPPPPPPPSPPARKRPSDDRQRVASKKGRGGARDDLYDSEFDDDDLARYQTRHSSQDSPQTDWREAPDRFNKTSYPHSTRQSDPEQVHQSERVIYHASTVGSATTSDTEDDRSELISPFVRGKMRIGQVRGIVPVQVPSNQAESEFDAYIETGTTKSSTNLPVSKIVRSVLVDINKTIRGSEDFVLQKSYDIEELTGNRVPRPDMKRVCAGVKHKWQLRNATLECSDVSLLAPAPTRSVLGIINRDSRLALASLSIVEQAFGAVMSTATKFLMDQSLRTVSWTLWQRLDRRPSLLPSVRPFHWVELC